MISYAVVARGNILVAAYSPDGDDLSREVQKLVERPFVKNEQRRVNKYIYTFLKIRQLTFICATPPEQDPKIAFKFLDSLSDKWSLELEKESLNAGPNSLSKKGQSIFESIYKEFSQENRAEMVKRELDQTQKIVTDSFNMALTRGVHLEKLSTDTEDLLATSNSFKNEATNLKKKMRCSYYKSLIIKIIVFLVVAYFILSFICGGLQLKPRCIKQ